MSRAQPVIGIAHRGAPLLHRENTLASLDGALALGARHVEIDVQATRDGEVIALHDETLDRLWNVHAPVSGRTLAQIRADTGTGPNGIPTLAECIDLVAGRGGVLHVDIADTRIARCCCDQPAVMAHTDAVVFTGDPDGLALVRDRFPGSTIAMSWEDRELPAAEVFERVRPQHFNQLSTLVDSAMVDRIHGLGMLVSVYTVDTVAEMHQQLDLGVDAIVSNDIALLLETLRHSDQAV